MQTHKFFFFEDTPVFGGRRGPEIAAELGGDLEGIFTNSTVWDLLDGRRLAVKNLRTEEIFFVDADFLVVAAGAVPFLPPFRNDDMPGVYTAAVVQKLMNTQNTLLGRSILTVGAGNIGYLTSYQLLQAGARVRAIIEAGDTAGGFPVQANRVRRAGIPILLSHTLVEAMPNRRRDGISGAIVARVADGVPVPGTERRIGDIDAINICTGLVPDSQLLDKGYEVFGRDCFGAGDAVRIGEGTTAVLRGRQVAYEILARTGRPYDYNSYLLVSKEYVDSQQQPVKILDAPSEPSPQRRKKPFVIVDCTFGFACNPCAFACPFGAITKTATNTVPQIDYERCTGCMKCIPMCPGLAIIGMNPAKQRYFIPSEFLVEIGETVSLVDNSGEVLGTGHVEDVGITDRVRVARVRADLPAERVMSVRSYRSGSVDSGPVFDAAEAGRSVQEPFICHCDDVKLEEILEVIGDRSFISIDEIKHTTRLGMGACRGKRCISRLARTLAPHGVTLVGAPTPRAPLSNQLELGELHPRDVQPVMSTPALITRPEVIPVGVLVAGGGIAGSALFRYFAEQGERPVLVNHGHGASWRNIAGGRQAFSLPELSDIAARNRELFGQLQERRNIDLTPTRYVTFAHDDAMAATLEQSIAWSNAFMIRPDQFRTYISPMFNDRIASYHSALVTEDCWQASPGKVVDLLRFIGREAGGDIREDCRLVDLERSDDGVLATVHDHDGAYVRFRCRHFVNALGPAVSQFAFRMGIETGLFAVKHQAFITRRLPVLGVDGPLPMLIDRRERRGFTAVYGQQLADTGQIIGCASPAVEPRQVNRPLSINTQEFLESVTEVFVDWLPDLSSAELQAVWAGHYVEPRMIIDPAEGLFAGLRGQGFMLGQYLAKLYVDSFLGRPVPPYFARLSLHGDGLREETLT